MKKIIGLAGALACASCGESGNSSTATEASSASLYADSEATAHLLNSNATEGLDGASTGEASSMTRFSLRDDDDDDRKRQTRFRDFSKQCEVNNGDAVVTIRSEQNFELAKNFGKMQFSYKKSGKSTQVRSWSKENADLQCNTANKEAKIDWTDPTGLSLKVDVNRERSMSMTKTNLKKGTEKSRSSSYSVNGTRLVTWLQSSTSGDTLTRAKQIETNVTRQATFKNSKGVDVSAKLNVITEDENPLIVVVERKATSPYPLKSKIIVSGKLIATFNDGGSVQTSFNILKFNIDSDQDCSVASGGFKVEFVSAEGTAVKTYSCSAEDGDLNCLDDKGESVNVDVPMCDYEDLY